MRQRVRASQAFTLVEVLIVVVIMAVLAAVVIPQFGSSTDDARHSTAEFNLSTLRSVLETFKGQHRGSIPAYDATDKTIPGLINKTDATGAINASGAYGPYLLEMPENPYTGVATVGLTTKTTLTSSDVTGSNAGGWLYNATTGQIFLDSDPGYDY